MPRMRKGLVSVYNGLPLSERKGVGDYMQDLISRAAINELEEDQEETKD